jgi:hypothetical protein
VYIDTNNDGEYEHLYNVNLITLALDRTTTFSHAHLRECDRLREEAEERGSGPRALCNAGGPRVTMRRMNAYSEDLRKKIVEALSRSTTKTEAARTFGVIRSSVKRYAKRAEEGQT